MPRQHVVGGGAAVAVPPSQSGPILAVWVIVLWKLLFVPAEDMIGLRSGRGNLTRLQPQE